MRAPKAEPGTQTARIDRGDPTAVPSRNSIPDPVPVTTDSVTGLPATSTYWVGRTATTCTRTFAGPMLPLPVTVAGRPS